MDSISTSKATFLDPILPSCPTACSIPIKGVVKYLYRVHIPNIIEPQNTIVALRTWTLGGGGGGGTGAVVTTTIADIWSIGLCVVPNFLKWNT